MTKRCPNDWASRVRLAIKMAKDEAARRRVADDAVELLRQEDPMDLRAQGFDAQARHVAYASQVMEMVRLAA